MDWSTVWEKLAPAITPVLLLVAVPWLIAYLREKIALVKDERLRKFLLDLVLAAEQMIPKDTPKPQANAQKLAAVIAAAPKGTPPILIEAAVAKMKGVSAK